MKTFEIVKNLMKEHNITKQTDLARIIYKKDKIDTNERVKVSSYLADMVKFPDDALKAIAEHFSVSLDFLNGMDDSKTKLVPIVGTASCGSCDINTLQDTSLKVSVPEIDWNKNLYAVIANGDSMATELYDGDKAIIDPNVKPVSGDIVYYKIDDEAAIKVLVIDEDAYIMQFVPYNHSDCFKTRTVRLDDEDTMNRLICHKVVDTVSNKRNNRAARLKMIGR